MIRIDSENQMEMVAGLLRSRLLVGVVFLAALGFNFIGIFTVVYNTILSIFVFLVPVYLFFVLFINDRKRWATVLVIAMIASFIPMQFSTGFPVMDYLLGHLPVITIVLYCIILNYQLKEWGY